MDFLISNFQFDESNKIGDLFYKGQCAKQIGDALYVRQSADCRWFGKYAEKLQKENAYEPITDDDFYFVADYKVGDEKLVLQTDIIGYEAVFVWKSNNYFAISDDVIALAQTVNCSSYGKVGLDEEKVREFLFYSLCLFEDTVFTNIKRVIPASITEIDVKSGDSRATVYDHFVMSGACKCVDDAAESADRYLDKYFREHYCPGVKYGIGMSGGLDSRVGAFYAKKHGYDIKPIFIGVKRNKLGIKTNDVKRSEAVNNYFGFDQIEYFDPRRVELAKKVAFDTHGAPNMSSNIHQNMGVLPGFDVLINAMMGGEAFGQLAVKDIDNYTDEQLANAMLYRFGGKPMYKTSNRTLIRLSKYVLPKGFVKKHIQTDDSVADELISPEQRKMCEERALAWVAEQKKLGLDNGNIWHKMFYYRFAVIAKTGYYSTFNNSIASLPTYINAGFVREMLTWSSGFLVGTQVQKKLILRLGKLADFRSQTFDTSISGAARFKRIKKLFYIAERAIRGGAMVYPAWFSKREIVDYVERNVKTTSIGSKIELKNKAWLCGESKWFTVMKVAFIERMIGDANQKKVDKNA